MINRRLIRIKVLQVLYAYSKKSENVSTISAEKELFHSIDKFYDLYLFLLLIGIEFVDMEIERNEMRKNKKVPTKDDLNPNTKFANNKVVYLLRNCPHLVDLKKERKLNVKIYSNTLKRIYNEYIDSEAYTHIINSPEVSLINDKKTLEKFYTNFLLENEVFNEFLEEENIYWNDDSNFAVLMVLKTIDSVKNEKSVCKVLPLFKNDDDKEYAKKLLRTAIVRKDEFLKIIEKHTKNWDTERIAQVDLMILQMAIAELFEFNSIPVKVTLNEYIEISKYYSTKKSKIFINGVLDNIIKQLEKDGKIKKTGRGLIEK